ncbi:MAG: riboflavin synthase [Halobacteriovoraceae bacterium]|nr:riboflavin synthase [Halobacteriovoraceae bacterium]|tara:strand:+ start:14586 stop:15179 length:594 start_codon:yes stop_codon:yes gene_type:complete
MFTGLIKDIGKIERVIDNETGKVFVISTPKLISQIEVDDSIATNGVCLTATEIKDDTFQVQAVHVTLEKSNLGELNIGDKVNLELALRASDRLGGHLVQGHVNGKGELIEVLQRGDNWEMEFKIPSDLRKYFIDEGSIAIDGISLTIAKAKENSLVVSIIPHTYENTTLGVKKIGESVNIEVDMMAKYLENFAKFRN